MKAFFIILVLSIFAVVCSGDQTKGVQTVKDVQNPDELRRALSRLVEIFMPLSGGDQLFYRDIKNMRIGIGTTAPTAALTVSTAAVSVDGLSLAGAFQTLPTSGYSRGTFAYQLSDNKAYASTETVVSVNSWKALW